MDYATDFAEQYVNTSMGKLHSLRHIGSGPKLLLIHGLGGTTRVWSRFVEFMPNGYDVTLLDLLGHGASDAPRIEYTVKVQVDALKEFLKATRYGDACIMGHSYGGWVAAYYASLYNIKALILEDAAGLEEQFDEMLDNNDIEAQREGLIKRLIMTDDNKEYVMRSIAESNVKNDQLTGETLSRINAPTLIIWGAEDNVIDRRFAKVFADGISNSQAKIIEGSGHTPHFAGAEDTAREVVAFISSIEGSAKL